MQPNESSRKKKWAVFMVVVLLCLGLSQLIRPAIHSGPVTADIAAPPEVKAVLKKACYDCHSNETNLRWYDQVAPVYWQVASHINDGKKVLNFSEWDKLQPVEQKAKLFESFSQIEAGAMPLSQYTMVHRDARLSPEDKAVLKSYLASLIKEKTADSTLLQAANKQWQQYQAGQIQATNVKPELNGVAFIPDYKNWQVISTSERMDNGTMRVIFGNPVAIEAVKKNNINPWPNGTVFAKVAWDALRDTAGNVQTGAFKQVELMIKDDQQYASTKGWGFGRWKTTQLVPYGKDQLFATECVNCHRPMKANDYVFTMPVKQ